MRKGNNNMITINTTTNITNIQNNIELTSIAIITTIAALNGANCTFPANENIDFNVLPKRLITTILNLTVVSQVKIHLKNIFDDAINIQDDGKFIISDKETIIKKLSEIIDEYGWDYDMSVEDFIRNIDRTAPLKYYPVTDLKYAPLILMEYLKNEAFIKNIEIHPTKWNFMNHHSRDYDFTNSFKATVDISSINSTTNKIIKSSTCKTKNKKEIKFSKMEKRIYEYLENWVKCNCMFRIEADTLIGELKLKNIDQTLSRFNAKYQKIKNIEEPLIRYNRREGYYVIRNEWNIIPNNIKIY